MTGLSDFQRFDPTNNLVEPWLTHPALDIIKGWDLSDKKVLEWGAGLSTAWWANKCERVMAIEANLQWFNDVNKLLKEDHNFTNVDLFYRNVHEGDQTKIDFYTDIPAWFKPDIIVVDGVLRNECLIKAIEVLSKNNGGYVIADNVYQDYVWLSPASLEIMKPYNPILYVQPDHTNHEGNPWKTGIFYVPRGTEKRDMDAR